METQESSADFAVTNVITGQPVPLHCVNQTARADAGQGSYSGQYAPGATGAGLDCCAGGGPELWWGPPFDVIDNAGPGRVRWGLDDGCPNIAVYDANADGALDCGEVPATGTLKLKFPQASTLFWSPVPPSPQVASSERLYPSDAIVPPAVAQFPPILLSARTEFASRVVPPLRWRIY